MANVVAAKYDLPTVEGVQDIVEMVLQAAGEFEAAKRYILYRFEHSRQRDDRPIPEEVRAAFAESDPYFPTPIQQFQFYDKYSGSTTSWAAARPGSRRWTARWTSSTSWPATASPRRRTSASARASWK